MLTEELLRGLCPHAREDYVTALVNGTAVLERWGFNTSMREAHFLAQVLHETGDLTIVRESMTYTSAARIAAIWPRRFTMALAEDVYGARMGNERDGIGDGDGYAFRGGGFPQLTGYDNYLAAGKAIGADLGGNPALIEDANISLAAACWEFSRFLKYMNLGERGLRAVSNGINRGNPAASEPPIGWSERQCCFRRVLDAMGLRPGPVDQAKEDSLCLGDHGPLVKAMQERLAALGYAAGACDGVFGARTRAAVLAFQAENSLPTDGDIGLDDRKVLNAEAARPMPAGSRAAATADDLVAAGSQTMSAAKAIQSTAAVAASVSAVTGAAKQLDVITPMQNALGELSAVRGLVTSASDMAAWAASHWWIGGIVISFAVWRWGRTIEWRRLVEHQLGLNLAH